MARFNLQQRITNSVLTFSRRQIAFVLNLIQRAEVEPRGYTLIELMVSIGIFSIVVAMTSAMFVTSLKGQEKSYTSQNVADSARYAMEMMSREIRMGTGFPPDGTGDSLKFVSTMPHRDGQTVKFWRDAGSSRIMFDDDISDAVSEAAITSANVSVTTLSFLLDGTSSHERITIVMRVESVGTKEDVKTTINLQTTVSPRRL